jgi:hypothetical protein
VHERGGDLRIVDRVAVGETFVVRLVELLLNDIRDQGRFKFLVHSLAALRVPLVLGWRVLEPVDDEDHGCVVIEQDKLGR